MTNSVVPPTINALMAGFDAGLFVTDPEIIARHTKDRTGVYGATPFAMVRPRSTEEVAALVRRCAELDLGIVPQGGLTGLVGAAVADSDRPEVTMLMDRLAAIRSVDPVAFTMVVEAGCILEVAKNAAEDQGCLLPITFGAQGSAQLGGNVATNAGGFNVLRYGMTRDLVLGLEVVLPDGRIWNGLRTLRKDNRGYDLKQLFIGSEGTLGIVTAISFKLFPKPTQVETAFIGLNSVEDAVSLFVRARRGCSDLLSAFELVMRGGFERALAMRDDLSDPLEQACPVYVLMELSATGHVPLASVLEAFLEEAADLIVDGTLAASQAQAAKLWLCREATVESQSRHGPYYRTDVSVPIQSIPAFLDDALDRLARALPSAVPVVYGHIGDGNIHLNVVPPQGMESMDRQAMFRKAEDIIFAAVDCHHGSISAEHGIGRSKKHAFMRRVDPVTLDLFRRIKQGFDPAGMMSLGRIFE